MKKLTKKEIEKIKKFYNSGIPLEAISIATNIDISNLRRIIKKWLLIKNFLRL